MPRTPSPYFCAYIRVRPHTGTLYGVLDRLREAGLIVVDREEVVESRLR